MTSFTYEYPRPSITVDCVVFGVAPSGRSFDLQVLLIRRGKEKEPFFDCWAIPGGFVNVKDTNGQGESLEQAAARELKEETGAEVAFLEQLYTFGAPGRDPRGRVISVAYYALVRSVKVVGADDAAEARWFTIPAGKAKLDFMLAFDHDEILETALKRLRAKVRYEPIGLNLLPTKFTLAQLQSLYEAVLGRSLDKGNFRSRIRDLQDRDVFVDAGVEAVANHPGRPSRLYRFDERKYKAAVKDGVHFEI